MKFGKEFGDIFSKYFDKQLYSILENTARDAFVKHTFYLPGNSRYSYIDKEYVLSEMEKTLNKFYPLGAKIAYIIPTPNDDHYIEVGALVKI